MRPTIHRTALALAALTLLLAGCGTEAGSEGGDGSDSASPSPPPSASASAGCTTVTGDLDATDSGDTVCLAVGATVRVSLDGNKDRPWQPVDVKGRGLEAANSGVVLLPGDASAAYKAVSAGTVRLSSSRPLCATETGKVSCKGIQEWRITVVVT